MGVVRRLPRRRSVLVVGVVLLLIFLVGRFRAAEHFGEGAGGLHEAGLWPVGLGAGLAVLAAGRVQRGAALVAVAVITLLTATSIDLGLAASGTLAAGAAVEAWVVARLVARDPDGRARLLDHADLMRLVVAGLAAAVTGAAVAGLALFAGIADETLAEAGPVVLVVVTTHLISHVLIVPFFLRTPHEAASAGRGEVVLQTGLVVVATPALFVLGIPGTVFLVFPLLAWGATRGGFRMALAQAALLGIVAGQLTSAGLGPFAVQGDDAGAVFGILRLQGYVLSGVAVILPLAIAIAIQHRRSADVVRERQRAEGLVRSTVGTAILATDLAGAVRLANPGAVDLFGYDAATLVTLSVADLLPPGELAEQAGALGVPPDLVAVMEAMSGASGSPGTRREWVVRRADGGARAHLLGIARLTDGRGAKTGYVLTSEDITDRIQLQESLTSALVAEREVVTRMKELDGVKEALVSSVSHELRTPITSILGFIEMLEDGDYGRLSEAQAQVLGRVSENGSRLLTLIDDLLALARIQDGVMPLDLQPLDLGDVVRSAWAALEGRFHGRDLRVSLQLPEGPARAEGDRDQLERLMVNLIGNAIKFTPDGGEVTVRLRRLGDRFGIDVTDTGIGIPQEEQAELFGRFFRSSLAAENAIQGTGLGLSIVKAIAEQHGGGVSVESEPGRGSTFRVDLPAAPPAEPADSAPVAPEPATVEAAPVSAEPVGIHAHPAVPAPAPEPAPAADRPTAGSRLAAARQSAGAQDPDDADEAARAILDAFGPRPGG